MKTKKCKSECVSVLKNDCLYPRCRWVNTKKAHCRLAPIYQLKDCKRVLKTPVALVNTYPSYLLLGDSGEVTVFGPPTPVLSDFFQYTNFTYVKDMIPTRDGYSLLYLKRGLTSYAELKKTTMHDAIVGMKYINPLLSRFPCFLYTYGVYSFTSLHISQLQSLTLRGIGECEPSYVLRQYLDNSEPLSKKHERYQIPILFIIYHALSSIVFTHHNLTMDNIMVWRPHPKKSIEYVYHIGKKQYTFECPYVVKITHYENAYFSNMEMLCENSTYDSKKDVSLARECGFVVPDEATVKQVYQLLKKRLVPSTGTLGRLEVYSTKMKYTHFK